MNSGVQVLPPYQRSRGADWYKGTANAIYQNMNYIDRYDPDYVVVLSGDHIYKMDYSKMVAYHKEKEAACTIAVIDVPLAEASRFGIFEHQPGRLDLRMTRSQRCLKAPRLPWEFTYSAGIN